MTFYELIERIDAIFEMEGDMDNVVFEESEFDTFHQVQDVIVNVDPKTNKKTLVISDKNYKKPFCNEYYEN